MSDSRLFQYGRSLNSHDMIKIIAVVLMIVDHVGEFLLNDNTICRLIGRGAAPLFFFLIGYVNHLHIRPSLIIYGFILSITNYFQFGHVFVNILLTFIFIQYCLWIFPPEKISTLLRVIMFILLVGLNDFVSPYVEYGTLGLLFVASARLIALGSPQASLWMILTLISYFIFECLTFPFAKNPVYLSSFVIILVVLYFIFMNYKFTLLRYPHPEKSNISVSFAGQALLLMLSRYSLEIYFFHLIILQGIFFYQAFHHAV